MPTSPIPPLSLLWHFSLDFFLLPSQPCLHEFEVLSAFAQLTFSNHMAFTLTTSCLIHSYLPTYLPKKKRKKKHKTHVNFCSALRTGNILFKKKFSQPRERHCKESSFVLNKDISFPVILQMCTDTHTRIPTHLHRLKDYPLCVNCRSVAERCVGAT